VEKHYCGVGSSLQWIKSKMYVTYEIIDYDYVCGGDWDKQREELFSKYADQTT
jgi:hypothetical protein